MITMTDLCPELKYFYTLAVAMQIEHSPALLTQSVSLHIFTSRLPRAKGSHTTTTPKQEVVVVVGFGDFLEAMGC